MSTSDLLSSPDTIWVLVCTALVFFMQAGFAMVETGLTRAKNAGNIIMKNLMDYCLGTPIFWLLGFGLMFGNAGPFIGWFDPTIQKDYSFLGLSVPLPVYIIFQTVFCATAATIVSGAMAERTKFISYCIYSIAISAIIYPVSGHWIWGGGWLSQLGFHDFAGSTAVHLVGGISALIGAKILGPRIGKYDESGKPKAILGHNLSLAALGVFILWFCWFGFNGGSTLSASGDDTLLSMGSIFMNTNLAAAVASITTMIITWIRYKKPDISMTLNGSLAGLVAITAGCDSVTPLGAAITGIIAGFVVVFGIEFVDKVLKVDDPVGAVGVHGFCGALGTVMVGFFSKDNGLFYGGGWNLLIIQALGTVSVTLWVAVTISLVFLAIKKTVGLRVSIDEEINGLDMEEHGLISSYADFMPVNPMITQRHDIQAESQEPVHRKTISVVNRSSSQSGNKPKMTKLVMIFNQSKFEALKAAMNDIGITGMTVTQVLGCGMQKGANEYYRGVPVNMILMPKVKVEIVVCKIPVRYVIDTAKRVLFTGHIGDGKIFVYDVENVIKIRTNEEGYDALQDD